MIRHAAGSHIVTCRGDFLGQPAAAAQPQFDGSADQGLKVGLARARDPLELGLVLHAERDLDLFHGPQLSTARQAYCNRPEYCNPLLPQGEITPILTRMGKWSTTASSKLDENGRIVIPAPLRDALQLKPGDLLTVHLDADARELRVQSVRDGIAYAQQLVARFVPRERSLVDELLADRRREVEAESMAGRTLPRV